MSLTEVRAPFIKIGDIDGEPLKNGSVYIGEAGKDAETFPISVFWDSGLSVPALQPVQTLNGYLSRSGTPANIYCEYDNYSITVRNKNGSLVYSNLSVEISTSASQNMYFYAVSQLAKGDESIVSIMSPSLEVDLIDWLIYPEDGRIYYSKGVTGSMAGDFNPLTGVDTGLSEKLYILDFMGFGSVYSYVVSQYADGDASNVSFIYPGLPVLDYEYFIYPDDGRVYAKNGSTGSFSNPLDFNPDTGIDSGLSSALIKLEFNNVNGLGNMGQSFTADATFTSADNLIVMNGIVAALGLEVGDAIQYSNADTNNNKARTVESITDGDTIIVNYEHCGDRGDGPLKLTDEAVIGATVKLLAKQFIAGESVGQDWVNMTSYLSGNTPYPNNTGRAVKIKFTTNAGGTYSFVHNGDSFTFDSGNAMYGFTIMPYAIYQINGASLDTVWELR